MREIYVTFDINEDNIKTVMSYDTTFLGEIFVSDYYYYVPTRDE